MYSSWSKQDLKDEAKRRGLPVSGSREDLVARLGASDAPQDPQGDPDGALGELLAQDEAVGGGEEEVATLPDPQDSQDSQVDDTEPPLSAAAQPAMLQVVGRIATAAYPMSEGTIPQAQHETFLRQVAEDVKQAGHRPRIGTSHRDGWSTIGGTRYAVYRVYLS